MNHLDKIIHTTINGNGDSDQLTAALFGIALTSRGTKFLELGVRSGKSTYPLLVAANILGGKLTSVDIDNHSFKCPETLKSSWIFIKSDAIEFLKQNKTDYDMIFIDDWHDGKHVSAEIDLLEKYCSPKTIILLHDLMYHTAPVYNKSENGNAFGLPREFDNGGPYRAVAGLSSDVWEYSTLPYNNGLTILRKKLEQ